MLKKSAVVALALSALVMSPVSAGIKDLPENKKLPPDANAGYFLGYPSPTYSWHGCTKTATRQTLAPPVSGQPAVMKGSKQSAVTFKVQSATPTVSWKVKDGWKICGVQVGVVLESPTVPSLLLAQAGYTSGPKKGSTVRSGKETIAVKIPKKGIGRAGFEEFEGQTFSIRSVQHVTVFVKKA